MADSPNAPSNLPETPVDAGSQALAEALRSSFAIVKVVMVVLLLVFLASGFFTVGPQQRGIILRLGRPAGGGELLGPGLHWSLPYPIDECVIVSITGIQQVRSSIGWYFTTATQEAANTEPPVAAGTGLNPAVDGYVLTADGNIVHARATLSYHIQDPIRFIFGFVNASNAVRSALDNALLDTAAHFHVDDILTRDRAGFNEAVQRRVTELAQQQELGIGVEQCTVESIPPRQLKEAFANVLTAEVNRNTQLYEARSFENTVTNQAGAEARSRINLAESDRARYVTELASRADEFQKLLPRYLEDPGLFTQRRLTETLGRILPNLRDKIGLSDSADGNSHELRLLLNREPQKPKSAETRP